MIQTDSETETRTFTCVRCRRETTETLASEHLDTPILVDMFRARRLCVECREWAARRQETRDRARETVVTLDELAAAGLLDRETKRVSIPGSHPELERCVGAWAHFRALNFSGPLRESHLFYGPPGTGKTHLARGCLTRAAFHRRTVAEMRARDFMQAFTSYGTPQTIIRTLHRADVLLLDDIGHVDWLHRDYVETFLGLLDARQDRMTIMTANYTPAEIMEAITAARPLNGTLARAIRDRLNANVRRWAFSGNSVRGA